MVSEGELRMSKRYKVHSMIATMDIGETMDLEVLQSLIEKYGSSADIELLITDNGKSMTYKEVADKLNKCEMRNKTLKRAKDVNDLTERILSLEKQRMDLYEENRELEEFKDRVFELIDKKIKEENYSAKIISDTLNLDEDYEKPVNILTIKALEQLKKELQND